MENYKDLSISLLNEMLKTYNNARMFAEYKLQYLTPCDPGSMKNIEEFSIMRAQNSLKVTQVANCISWLSTIEPNTNQQ